MHCAVEGDLSLRDIEISPVSVSQRVYALKLTMVRKVDDLTDGVSNIFLIVQQIDFLLIVQDEERLRHSFLYVILDAVGIEDKSNK